MIRGSAAFVITLVLGACGGPRSVLAPTLAPEPAGEVLEAIYDLVIRDLDPEVGTFSIVQRQVGNGPLESAARVDVTQDGWLNRWLIVKGPLGWSLFTDKLLEGSVESEEHWIQHKERSSSIMAYVPDVGPLLVIEVDRAEEHEWGNESTVVRWYCAVLDGDPLCFEVEVSFNRLELTEDGYATTERARDVEVEDGVLVVGPWEVDGVPQPATDRYDLAPGRYAIEDLPLARGVVVHASERVMARGSP